MNRIAKFFKVSPELYFGAKKEECSREYEKIKLPQRANLLNQPVPHSDDASAQAKHA